MKGPRSDDERDGVILFVCTGNTCRSPLAAALWAALAPDAPPAASAGVGAWTGAPAADPAQQVAREYGVDLSAHRARHVRDVTEPVRRVYVMTRRQREQVAELRPEWADRIELLTEAAGDRGDIPDPLGTTVEVYRGLAERLVALMHRVRDRDERREADTKG
jgi:protein-tyrosine-phosphatase